jgi:hypothetical protein
LEEELGDRGELILKNAVINTNLDPKCYSFIRISPLPDPGLRTATASLLITVYRNG